MSAYCVRRLILFHLRIIFVPITLFMPMCVARIAFHIGRIMNPSLQVKDLAFAPGKRDPQYSLLSASFSASQFSYGT